MGLLWGLGLLISCHKVYAPNFEPKIWRQSLRLSASSMLSRAFRAVAAEPLTCVMKSLNSLNSQCFATLTDRYAGSEIVGTMFRSRYAPYELSIPSSALTMPRA